MSLLNQKDVRKGFTQRVREAARIWTRADEPRLAKRNRMVSSWVSGYCKSGTNAKAHTMNLMDRAIGILVPYLSMSDPNVHCEARIPKLKPWAYTTQLAMNHLLKEIKFSKTVLRPSIFNSMFGSGIVKTGIMKEWESSIYGNNLDIGQPYAAAVDDEDYIGDVSANTREEFEMEGNYYVMPTQLAKEFFGARHADSITPSFKLFGDNSIKDVVRTTTQGSDYHTLRYWTKFMDVYLPDEGITLTLLADGNYYRILKTTVFDGPGDGPYDLLGYKYAMKQPMPIPPAWGWIDMDTALNVLINKMRVQAEAQKNILVYAAEAQEDADRMAATINNGTCKVNNLDAVKAIELGGTNPENYEWVSYIEQQFSIQGGNLYQLGGRGTQAETLGQEQMLMTNASRIVDDMVNSVYDFTQSVMKKFAWYIWNDPMIQIPTIKRIEGAGSVEVIFDKYAREGDFYDFNFKIQPYSMQRFNPSIQSQKLMQFLAGWVLPVLPMAAQQGVKLNIDAATTKIAEYLQLDIQDIWQAATPMGGNDMGPYQPSQGQVSQKQSKMTSQGDDRFGSSGASRMGNFQQYANSPRAGQSSPPQK